ncbi:MAG TPA: MFS transporter [Burkholderiales bacterium]|nr:MFS transporter [Burkholderiales bacterium]
MSSRASTAPQDFRIIGLVALAHGVSHFFQISTAVLFPLIKGDLGVSYTALGATVALYYVVSGICQTLAGFAVDRYGARRVLFTGLALATAGAALAGFAQSYAMLVAAALVGGLGNSVFHPCDFSILNARVRKERLGYAFSGHGIAGYLGYAAAPAYAVALAAAVGWREALLGAALIGAAVVAILAVHRDALHVEPSDARKGPAHGGLAEDIRVLTSLPVLMCFAYFILVSVAFIAMQNFGVASTMALYGVGPALASAALTSYLLGGAAGILTGGFVAVRATRHDLVAVAGMAVSAAFMFLIAAAWLPAALLPALCAAAGFSTGLTNPSRDLIVRTTTPPGSTGKVYGFVYSGLDVGSMVTPVYFGWLLDGGRPSVVFYTVVVSAVLTIATVLNLPGTRPAPAKA